MNTTLVAPPFEHVSQPLNQGRSRMFGSRSKRRGWIGSLGVLTALLAMPTSASAQRSLFFEETASAFWAVPFACADGSVAEGTLLVQTTRDFESPDTEDADPTARVQFLAVCPDGTSFSWGGIFPRLHHEHPEPEEA